MALEKTSTVLFHKSKDKTYFKTFIPRDIALNVLGLKTDKAKQRLTWSIVKGKIVVGTT